MQYGILQFLVLAFDPVWCLALLNYSVTDKENMFFLLMLQLCHSPPGWYSAPTCKFHPELL
jgi:hypothetical protein